MSTFDIFLKGVKPNLLDEADQIKLLASEYLKIEITELESLLSAPGVRCFRRGVSEQDANELQINLSKLGMVCVCKPGVAASNLSLTSMESKAEVGNIYNCPNCNHPVVLAENQLPPEECEKCGIINKKLLDAQKIAAETAEIRNNILRAQRAKESFNNKQREEEEAEKRKKNIESQVLAELNGNKKKKNIDIKMLAAGAVSLILVGGISYTLGVVLNKPDVVSTEQPAQVAQNTDNSATPKGDNASESQPAPSEEALQSSSETSPEAQEQSLAVAGSDANSQTQMPAGAGISMEEAHDKANKVLNAVGLDADATGTSVGSGSVAVAAPGDVITSSAQSAATNNTGDLFGGGTDLVNQDSAIVTNNSSNGNGAPAGTIAVKDTQPLSPANTGDILATAMPSDLSSNKTSSILSKGENSVEWDLFLSKSITSLNAKSALSDALKLGNHIVDTEDYINAMGAVLETAQKTKNSQLVKEILTALETRIGKYPNDKQVQYFAQAGFYQSQATGSNNLLERAEKNLVGLTDPETQLKSSLKVAVNYSKVGNNEVANRYFKQITPLLSKIQSADRQISSRIAIARAYKDVGSPESALKWLASTDKLIAALTGETRQELVESYAYTNQLQPALDLIKKAEPSNNELLFKAINVSLKSDLPQNAITLSNEIQDPFYKAIAHDQIASYVLPASDYLALAEKSLADIKNPTDQAVISSLLARHYARIANPEKAKALAQSASLQASKLADSAKDELVMVITKNLARSLQIEAAKEQLNLIQSKSLKGEMDAEISKSAEVGTILKTL